MRDRRPFLNSRSGPAVAGRGWRSVLGFARINVRRGPTQRTDATSGPRNWPIYLSTDFELSAISLRGRRAGAATACRLRQYPVRACGAERGAWRGAAAVAAHARAAGSAPADDVSIESGQEDQRLLHGRYAEASNVATPHTGYDVADGDVDDDPARDGVCAKRQARDWACVGLGIVAFCLALVVVLSTSKSHRHLAAAREASLQVRGPQRPAPTGSRNGPSSDRRLGNSPRPPLASADATEPTAQRCIRSPSRWRARACSS